MSNIRVFCSLLLLSVASLAQNPAPAGACPLLPALSARDSANLFSDERENDLGDAVAQAQREYHVIEDAAVNAFLQSVGQRLLKQLPPSGIHYQFLVMDTGEVNAYSFPGGRIYVTRKLIAAARSEDELAGVLAHEIGHIVTHQAALRMSDFFRKGLQVTSLKDRADVFERYHQLMERSAVNPAIFQRPDDDEEKHQKLADDVALYVVAKAGYRPQAYAEFWDRMAETKGKTGGWLSDLFGSTKPESKRLRQMLKTANSLPPGCLGPQTTEAATFTQWQQFVAGYTLSRKAEPLAGVVFQKVLDPPLRSDLHTVHFSPDGKFILAQDDSSVFVLTREPLKVLFRIDAREAAPAHFTPDSTQVVLHNDNLRVEGWSIADQKRVFVKEVVVPKGCMQSTLSPDGKVLACFGENFELLLLDVASGTEIYRKESFYSPESVTELINWMVARLLSTDGYQFISLEFSPDSKFFIGAKSTTSLAFDFETKKPIKMKGMMSEAIRGDFAFLAPDRVIGLNVFNTAKSWVVRFPTGEKLQELALGISKLSAPAKGNYVMMRPVKKFAVGVVDIAQNKGVIANKLGAFDIYENVYATQRRDGELAIYPLQAGQAALAAIPLPKSPLSRIRALALSPNLDFLAVSERNRGAVWDLSNSKRLMHVRGFRGAYLDDAKRLYADFPKQDEGARVIAKFEVMTNFSYDSIPLGDNRASQNGPFLVLTKPKKKDETSSNATLEIQDVRTSLVLWKRDFPKEVPEHEINPRLGTMVLRWKMTESAAKQEIKSDPALASKVSAMGDKEGDYLMIVVDAKTGKNIGKVLIETGKGSFHIHSMMAAGDTLIVTDSNNRVLVYSIKEGKQLARTFGDSPSISPDGRLLAIQNEVGVISIFEAGTLKKHHELHFADDVALTDFSEDGKRLFILTRDQTVYLIDLDKQKELLAKN